MAATKRLGRTGAALVPAGLISGLRRHVAGRRDVLAYAVLGAALALHLVLFLAVFPSSGEGRLVQGFLPISYRDSGRTLDGALPYRDFLLEYPPGTLLFMLLPRLFAAGYLAFRTLFFVEVALLDVIVLVTLYASARTAGLPVLRALGLYTVAIVLLGPVTSYRLDLAPAMLTAVAMLAWLRDRAVLAALLLAAATATKAYPALLLPPLLMEQWTRGRKRSALLAALAFVVALGLFLSPMAVAFLTGPQQTLVSLRFQTNRHLQVESIWATLPLLLHVAGLLPLLVAGRERALVILGPGDALGAAGTPALALAILTTYALWWRLRARPDLRSRALLTGTAALVCAAAILTKVLSPQYLLWIMPALALLPLSWTGRSSRLLIAAPVAFGVALPLTQWIYPLHYGELVHLIAPRAVEVLALRNLLLVLTLLALLGGLWRLGKRPVPSRQPPAGQPAVAAT